MIESHFRAGSGAVLVETREESRFLRSILNELPTAAVCTVAAPGGALVDARSNKPESGSGLMAGYKWAQAEPGRVLIVWDWHMLANNPGHWRALIESLPGLRSPKGASTGDAASLVVFVAPSWDIQPNNPLKGSIPILPFAPPSRTELRDIAAGLHTLNGEADAVADALTGLSADTAEQAAAECLAAKHGWDAGYLRGARRQLLREAGMEIWPSVAELGGLTGLRDFATAELFPWVRDPQLSVRRLLMAGVPGVGKSYCARWLAHNLGCECVRLSIPALKAGIVGASEANLRRALRALDALAAEAPLVCVLDEIDTIAREGMDGGTSAGMFAELLTWLQESTAQAVVVATLNRLDKLDAALESRFQARFFFDLPSLSERQAVARIHYARLGCDGVESAARATADYTEGYASREIAEHICPSVARRSDRKPTAEIISQVASGYTPASRTQAEQIQHMRRAAASLRRANDPEDSRQFAGRRIGMN